MTGALVGTSGWGYPSWQPGFYPVGLDRSDFLSFYAGQLGAVELNATKYRLPSEDQFRSWAAQVPDGLRFAVKAPSSVERRLDTFEQRIRCLGDRLGCVRVVVERPRDDGLLELLLGSTDPSIRYALDLRDPTWDGVEERLASAGAVRVGDRTGRAGWAYLRYRELHYTEAELAEIGADLDALGKAGTETYAFFRHGDEPDAAAAAVHIASSRRFRLVPMTPAFLEAVLADRRVESEEALGGTLPPDYPAEDDRRFLAMRLQQMQNDARFETWCPFGVVLGGEMIGHAGYHGPPGVNGPKRADAVELGYTIFEPYRRRGHATAAVEALIEKGVKAGVVDFVLSVSPTNEPSLAIARRLGFVKTGEQIDDEDGLELILELQR